LGNKKTATKGKTDRITRPQQRTKHQPAGDMRVGTRGVSRLNVADGGGRKRSGDLLGKLPSLTPQTFSPKQQVERRGQA